MPTRTIDVDYDGHVAQDGSIDTATGTLGLISNNFTANSILRTFLRFPLTGLTAGQVAISARLDVRVVSDSGLGAADGIEVHPYNGGDGNTNPAGDSGVTRYNRCDPGGTPYATQDMSPGTPPQTFQINLSAAAVADINANKSSPGFLAIGLSQFNLDVGDTIRIAMLEHASEQHAQLVVTYSETHSGQAALSGTGALSAAQRLTARGAAAFTGAAALSGLGATKRLGLAALAGTAVLAAAATVTQAPLTGNFLGSATIEPEAHITARGRAAFTGSGQASFLGGFKRYGAVSPLAGTATVSMVPRYRFGGALTLAGRATLTPAGTLKRSSVDPNIQTGQAWALVYDNNDANLLGILPRILPAVTIREVNKIGAFEFMIPEMHESIDLVDHGRYVRIYYEGSGLRFRGIIENWVTMPSDNGVLMRRIWGSSLAAELAFENTYQGIELINVAANTGFSTLLARKSDWTKTTTGTYSTQSGRYDWMSLFEAAVRYGQGARGYVRETNTARELELKNTHGDSGLVLGNTPQHSYLPATSPSIVPIKATPEFRTDGSKVFNRIVPVGRGLEGSTVSLQRSTRSTPYPIQNMKVINPSVVDFTSSTTRSAAEMLVRSSGNNRVAVAMLEIDGDWSANEINIALGGRQMVYVRKAFFSAQSATHALYYLINPPLGELALTIQITGWTSTQAEAILSGGCVYVVQDADQVSPIRTSAQTSSAGSTSVTGTVTGLVAGDLVLDNVVQNGTGATATPTGGQTELYDYNIPTGISRRRAGGHLTADASSESMTWTLSASRAWNHLIAAIKPALNYYIEDTTSIAAYSADSSKPRVKVLPDIKMRVASDINAVDLANALYDYAADFLSKHKDPVELYQAQPDFLPDDTILPGDSCRFLFSGMVEESGTERRLWKQVDATFVIIAIKEIMGDAVRSWDLTIATVLREWVSPDGTVANIIGDVGDLYDAAAT